MLKSIDMSHLVERLVHRPSGGLAEGMMLAAVGASVSPRPGTVGDVLPGMRVRQPANSDTARCSRDPGYAESTLRVAGTPAFLPSP